MFEGKNLLTIYIYILELKHSQYYPMVWIEVWLNIRIAL